MTHTGIATRLTDESLDGAPREAAAPIASSAAGVRRALLDRADRLVVAGSLLMVIAALVSVRGIESAWVSAVQVVVLTNGVAFLAASAALAARARNSLRVAVVRP